jgi:hypothetical protein
MHSASAKDLIVSSLQSVCGQGACGPASLTGIAGAIANVLIFLTGATAVIMVIIGGLKYVLSAGNPAQVANAKNTILYSVIGLVVAISSYAIVNFVLTAFK